MNMQDDFNKWAFEYLPNDLEDDDLMFSIKDAINSLNTIQRKIWLTYVELGSYAAVGRAYGVSRPTARKYLLEIKQKIIDKLND